jgi:hypothetical protein
MKSEDSYFSQDSFGNVNINAENQENHSDSDETDHLMIIEHQLSKNSSLAHKPNLKNPEPESETKRSSYLNRSLYLDDINGKIGNFMVGIFLFRSVVDIGLFATPYSFSKVGYILGATLTITVAYASGYGIYIMAKICNELEDQPQPEGTATLSSNGKITTLFELAMRCTGNFKYIFKCIVIILVCVLNLAILVGNMANTANFLFLLEGIGNFWPSLKK